MKTFGFAIITLFASILVLADDPSIITLQTDRSSAVVSLQGGLVMSFKTGGEEVLWKPKAWNHRGDRWCHGGIPLCWPWFGRSVSITNAIHGLAWRSRFSVRNRKTSAARCELVLGLTPTPATRKVWPHDFDLEYTIVLTDTLKLRLKTKNTGVGPFTLTKGFHPYFFIGDRDRTVVTGTDGMKFCDSRQTKMFGDTWKGNMKLVSSFDHVFVEPYPTALHKIIDPVLDRCISASSSGAKRLVVWNPGVEGMAFENPAPGDLAIGDWRHFVCVEPAILWKDAAVTVQPGASYEIVTEISLGKGAKK